MSFVWTPRTGVSEDGSLGGLPRTAHKPPGPFAMFISDLIRDNYNTLQTHQVSSSFDTPGGHGGMIAGCPILAVPLFLRQGWDEQMPARLLPLLFCLSFPEESAFSFASVEEPAGWPILAAFLFLRLGWVSQMPATKFVRSANPYRSPTRMASS